MTTKKLSAVIFTTLTLSTVGFLSLIGTTQAQERSNYTLTAGGTSFPIETQTLNSWKNVKPQSKPVYYLNPEKNIDSYTLVQLGLREQTIEAQTTSKYNIAAIYTTVRELETKINQPTKDAVFEVENNRVIEFNPGQKGQSLDVKASIDQIIKDLDAKKTNSTLSVRETLPTKDLASSNSYGIKELVSLGESDFRGSPANRVHNIRVGVEKEKGILLAPGDEFSFNKYLGPVDGEHGFLPELVIKRSGTIKEFGGGLCQVSSTVFRAAMNAGLPIVERRNHSYAVQYYAPQGTDATIYPGVVDFRFKNDTPGYLLVWPSIPESGKLQFALYGQKDSRKIAVDAPYSYDKKTDGSMKAVWSRTVILADGTEKKDTFRSTYQPPALFHTQPAASTPASTTPTPPTDSTPTPPTDTQTPSAPVLNN